MITRMIVRAAQSAAVPLLLLTAAVFLASCGADESPTASDVEQHSETAAKFLKKGISVEKLKSPRSVMRSDGRLVEKKLYIFYRTGPEVQKESLGEKSGGKDKKCFAFLGKGTRWKTAEPYFLDASNGDGLEETVVVSTIAASLETWNSAAGFPVFGSREIDLDVVVEADADAPDGRNEVLFANINEPGIIAVTIVWGVFSGKPADRELVEWDMVFDDPVLGEQGLDLSWGDAGPTSETELGDTSVMDFQNIATHEAGHAAGLDHPKKGCAEETMYEFASEGETKKRTLNTGDIAGLTQLYQ